MGLEDSLPSEGRRGRPASERRRRCRRRRRRPRGPTRGGELPGETRLLCCDPRRADQRGGCERNHVEIRKPPPEGRGVSFDRLTRAGAALVTSQVNSEPRGRLAWRSPAEMLLAALGGDARPHGRLRGRDARARRARPDAGVRGARPRRWGRGAAGGVAPRGQPNRVRGTRRAESGSGARRVGGACPSDSSRRPATNPTPAGTCAGGPFRCLPAVSLTAETRCSLRLFR